MFVLITLFILPIQVAAFDYEENDIIIDYLPGDLDGNEKVTAADARLCIRAAAKLETLSAEQLKAADFDGTGKITTANARKILRASAKIEEIDVVVNIEPGQRIVAGPYINLPGGFLWSFNTTSAKTTITRISENNLAPGVVGNLDQFFTIVTDEDETFIVTLFKKCSWTGEIDCNFNLIINING